MIEITLTENSSCQISPNQPSFTIGKLGMNSDDFDVLIGENTPINWEVFEDIDSIKWFVYHGNDLGFISLSEKRKISHFTWYPTKHLTVNFSKSQIRGLTIESKNLLTLVLGQNIFELSLFGELNNYAISGIPFQQHLTLGPKTTNTLESYQIPSFTVLQGCCSLTILNQADKQAIDLDFLNHYKAISSLNIHGNCTNWKVLKKFDDLNTLGLRFIPDLSDFPTLSNFPNLKTCIGYKIEENSGNELLEETESISQINPDGFYKISDLRKSEWLIHHAQSPFLWWKSGMEEFALNKYQIALKSLKISKTENEVVNALRAFLNPFKGLDYIKTSQQDDLFYATEKLLKETSIHISKSRLKELFEAVF